MSMISTQSALEKQAQKMLLEFQSRINKGVTGFKDTSPEQQKNRLRDGEWDNDFFGKTYLPQYFSSPKADGFHDDLDELSNVSSRHIIGVAGPREHAKSIRLRAGFLRRILFGHWPYPIVISEDLKDAKKHTFDIFSQLTTNPRILHDFEVEVVRASLVEGLFQVKITNKSTGKMNHCAMESFSYGTKVKGSLFMHHRPSACLIDDFENTRSGRNPKISREKKDWVKQEVYGAVNDSAPIIWLGNMGHDSSALYKLFLDYFEEDETLLRNYLKLGENPGNFSTSSLSGDRELTCFSYRATTTLESGDIRYLWPQRYPESWYSMKRSTMGAFIFESEENQNPVAEGSFFKREWIGAFVRDQNDLFRLINHESEPRLLQMDLRGCQWYTWFDPAFGQSSSSCYKAIVVIASNGFDYALVDGYCRNSETVHDALAFWYTLFERWQPYGLRHGGYENNFGQDNRLQRDLDDVAREKGYRLPVAGDGNSANKIARIESLEPTLSQGRFWTPKNPSKDVQTIVNQILGFPDGDIDGADALESAFARLRFTTAKGNTSYESLKKRRYAR